jgi:hypothetical protein
MTETTTSHAYKAGDRVAIDARIRDENDEIIAIHGDTATIVRLLDGDEEDLVTDGDPGPFYAVRFDHLSEDVEYACEASIVPAADEVADDRSCCWLTDHCRHETFATRHRALSDALSKARDAISGLDLNELSGFLGYVQAAQAGDGSYDFVLGALAGKS